MTICSRTIGYYFKEQYAIVFPIVLLLFCNLKIPKQSIEMQVFFLNGLWRFLKNGHLPVKLHSSAPPGSKNYHTHHRAHHSLKKNCQIPATRTNFFIKSPAPGLPWDLYCNKNLQFSAICEISVSKVPMNIYKFVMTTYIYQ